MGVAWRRLKPQLSGVHGEKAGHGRPRSKQTGMLGKERSIGEDRNEFSDPAQNILRGDIKKKTHERKLWAIKGGRQREDATSESSQKEKEECGTAGKRPSPTNLSRKENGDSRFIRS